MAEKDAEEEEEVISEAPIPKKEPVKKSKKVVLFEEPKGKFESKVGKLKEFFSHPTRGMEKKSRKNLEIQTFRKPTDGGTSDKKNPLFRAYSVITPEFHQTDLRRSNSLSTCDPQREALSRYYGKRNFISMDSVESIQSSIQTSLQKSHSNLFQQTDQSQQNQDLSSPPLSPYSPGGRKASLSSSRSSLSALNLSLHTSTKPIRIRFNETPEIVEITETHYPSPPESKQYPLPGFKSDPKTCLADEHKKVVVAKLRMLIKEHSPLTYSDLLRISIGKFSFGAELPAYVEDFMEWLIQQKWIDPVTGQPCKVNWMDRRWLLPIIQDTWGVHIKYAPAITL